LILTAAGLSAQTDSTSTVITKPWKFTGTFAFNLNESTFTNWVAGGDNQITTATILRPNLIFDNKKWSWETLLDVRHGLQKIGSDRTKKSEDLIRLESKLGRHISKNWKFSGYYSFYTQARPSYDGDKLVSTFMAPSYTNINLGFDFNPAKSLSIFMTPANIRTTYVLNDTISARGDFGVEPGKTVLVKFGPSFLISYKDEILKNVNVDTKFGFFQDILDGLGDPVINWDAIFSMKVNKYMATTFTFALFYDKNSTVDIKDANGVITGKEAKIQFKQTFGFGLNLMW
jgi:hypothetical protein